MFDNPKTSLSELVKKEKVDLDRIIESVIKENPETVNKIKTGDEKSVNFLVGQVLRKANFKGDPKDIMKKLKERIV